MKQFKASNVKNLSAEELAKILEPLYHRASGSYNKWTMQRDKKLTYSYPEALEEIKRLGNAEVVEDVEQVSVIETLQAPVAIEKQSFWSHIRQWLSERVSWFTKLH